MKKFIYKTFIFIAPLLIISILMEIALRPIPNEYEYKRIYMDTNSKDIETLILGSSHTEVGLNPIFFSTKTFNAAHFAQMLYWDKQIFDRYKKELQNLKTIIIPISYPTFWGSNNYTPILKNDFFYNLYCGFPVKKTFDNSFALFHYGLSASIKMIYSSYIIGSQKITCTKLGWRPLLSINRSLDLARSAKKTLNRHTIKDINSEENQRIFKENISILKSIIKWSRNKKINVLLLTTPTYKTYYENLNNKQLKETVTTATKLAEEFDNCHYIDLLACEKFTVKDFHDSSHLSEIGAKKLSILINNEISKW